MSGCYVPVHKDPLLPVDMSLGNANNVAARRFQTKADIDEMENPSVERRAFMTL